MNKHIIFIFMVFAGKFVFAQTYQPMLDNDSEWHITNCASGCFTDVYYTDGDTVENGLTYTVLNGFHYISRTFWLRENNSTQKVFMSYIDPGHGRSEVLLYDFSVAVGDSFEMRNPASPFPFDAGFFIVDSIINTSLFDNHNYRQYYFSPTTSNPSNEKPIWIESIGSLTLINGPGGTPNVNSVGKLSCFFKEGFLNYSQLDSINNCSAVYVTGIDNIPPEKYKIYPTLCPDFLSIDISSDFEFLEIYNTFGQLIVREELVANNKIDMREFENGLYFIKLISQTSDSSTIKIIKV